MRRLLGAVLAGGQARRFGSDKALALLGGMTLLDRVSEGLAVQTEAVIVCGRAEGLADRPPGGLGPLAGINAALHAGLEAGFYAVLSVPCDAPVLPPDLRARLEGPDAACLADTPVIGFWPCTLAPALDAFLAQSADRSMRAWAAGIGARIIRLPDAIPNINTPADLAKLAARPA